MAAAKELSYIRHKLAVHRCNMASYNTSQPYDDEGTFFTTACM